MRTPRRAWIVPPSRALWVPSHTVHEIQMYGVVEMRSLYVDAERGAGMPSSCVVLDVTPLLRELIVRAVALPERYDEEGDDGLLMQLLMAEIRRLPHCALDLPLPESPDLSELCERILADLSARRPCGIDAADMNTSTRTLYRRFLRETGITFARWKQQARLLESIRRLAEGHAGDDGRVDLGYESPERVLHHVPALAGHCAEGVPRLAYAAMARAPRTISISASGAAGSSSPRHATCWSGRTSTSLRR